MSHGVGDARRPRMMRFFFAMLVPVFVLLVGTSIYAAFEGRSGSGARTLEAGEFRRELPRAKNR